MKKSILLVFMGLLFNLSLAQQTDEQQISAKLDKMLGEQYKANETGATVLIARKGQVIYKKAFGLANLEYNIPMQVDNVFKIGSLTKQFTSVAILQLMEQGKLSLQDEVNKFIPDYLMQGHKITIENLLTHTSGIHDYTDMTELNEVIDMTPRQLVDYFKDLPMDFVPGSRYSYNNGGYFLLGYIVELVSGKTYQQYVEENFFQALGMTHSLYGSDKKIVKNRVGAYEKDSTGFINARYISLTQANSAGALQSTVEDLFKWHEAVHSYKVLKKETLDKAFTKYKLNNGQEITYGYGWNLLNVWESPTIGHSGNIYGSHTQAIYLPNEDVFVAIFANCDCNSPYSTAIKMAALAIGNPYEFNEIHVDSDVLQTYTGVFENERGQKRNITFTDDKLYMSRGDGSQKQNIKPFAKDAFSFGNNIGTVYFSRNEKGELEKITVKGYFPTEYFVRIK